MKSLRTIQNKLHAHFNRVIITLFFALILSAGEAKAESLAERYEEARMYSHAILEYKRNLFLADRAGGDENPEDWYGIARCYSGEGDYVSASSAFARFMESGSEYTKDICALELLLIEKNDFSGFYRIRLYSLLRMPMNDRGLRKKILLLNGKAAVMGSEWDNVRAVYGLLADGGFIDSAAGERGEKIIIEAEALRSLSPILTGTMSAIIPGSGQTLAGYPLDGTKALAINGSIAGLSVYTLFQGDLPDFFMFDLPLFTRFYLGNIDNARKAALERDIRKASRIKELLLKQLEEIPD
jgi:tetratricopeptide (TPR) repeat protein